MKEEKIIEGAKILSKKMLGNASWCAKEFKRNYNKHFLIWWKKLGFSKRKISDEKQGIIFYQFLFLFYHLVDRIAFEVLGSENRKPFMGILWLELFEISLIKEQPHGMSEYRGALKEMYGDFIDRYDNCKEFVASEKDGSLAGTLLWEFGKDLAEILFFQKDVGCILLCNSLVMEALGDINIKEVIKNIKN